MANITKRVNKKLADRLHPGEEVQIAILCEPKDTYGKGAAGLVIAPGLQLRRLGKKAAEERQEEGGMAASFPARSCVLAVTGQRILVVDSNGIPLVPIGDPAPQPLETDSVLKEALEPLADLVTHR